MKSFVPAVIALVVGIVLGAWEPRGELLDARKQMDELRAKAHNSDCRGGKALDGIRDLLHAKAPEELQDAAADDAEPKKRAHLKMQVGEAKPVDPPTKDGDAPPAPPLTPEEIKKSVSEMQAALDARRSQALAALTEQANLNDDQVAAVDAAMSEMNGKLKTEVDDFVTASNGGQDPDRRDAMEFAANTLDAVIAADDKMRDIIPADVYDTVDPEAVDPFSYISGDAVPGLANLKEIPDFQ